MRKTIVLCSALLLAEPLRSERYKLELDQTSAEGLILMQITVQTDPQKRMALMEDFLTRFPKHPSVGWVYTNILENSLKDKEWDKALVMAEKLLSLDASDVEAAHAGLKSAEAKRDAALIQRWALLASDIARKEIASTKPEGPGAKEYLEYAQQIDAYTEYSLYALALENPDVKKRLELFQLIESRYPKGRYLAQIHAHYFSSANKSADKARAIQIAEGIIARGEPNEDMLLTVLNHYYEGEKDREKVLLYSSKLIEYFSSRARPEGVSAAGWQTKKAVSLGLAHWMAGVTQSFLNQLAESDRSLRAALPYLKGNAVLLAEAYFHLGLVNFKMGEQQNDMQRIGDAVRFNELCAAIPGQFREQALRHNDSIRGLYRVP